MMLWLQLLLCLAVIGYAVGDVLGNTVFNLAILLILDALHKLETIYTHAAQGHILSASLGTVLGLTWVSLGLLMLYVLNSWLLFGQSH